MSRSAQLVEAILINIINTIIIFIIIIIILINTIIINFIIMGLLQNPGSAQLEPGRGHSLLCRMPSTAQCRLHSPLSPIATFLFFSCILKNILVTIFQNVIYNSQALPSYNIPHSRVSTGHGNWASGIKFMAKFWNFSNPGHSHSCKVTSSFFPYSPILFQFGAFTIHIVAR